jgi:hypothetical protein
VALGADFEMSEIFVRWETGKELLLIVLKIDLVKHEFACLFIVRELVYDSKIIGSHILVMLHSRAIRC